MFYLDVVSLDWLTVTTFNPVVFNSLRTIVERTARKVDKDKRRMQYHGILAHHEDGTAYLGDGEQKGRTHYLIQLSGLWADTLWPAVAHHIQTGKAKCTRIDLQVTREYDRASWSQSDIADTLRARNPNRSVSYVESVSGPAGSKLATVYYGSRKSDRFVRLYEKMGLGEDVYLRFEAEYKAGRATAVANALRDKPAHQILANEVARMGLKAVADVFDLSGPCVDPVVIRPEPATVKWLREQVAPALDRVINDHNINTGDVEALFRRILGCTCTD